MRVPSLHLVADGIYYIVESERSLLARHLRVKYDLKQQVAELVPQTVQIVSFVGIRNFIRFLDRVRRNRTKALLQVPWTTRLRISQASHDGEEAVNGHGGDV